MIDMETKPPQFSLRALMGHILGASLLAGTVAAPAWAEQMTEAASGQGVGRTVDPDAPAHAQWREGMKQYALPGEGCFHASYPNFGWEKVECSRGQPRSHPVRPALTDDEPSVVGDGNDYVAYSHGLISQAEGALIVDGVKSESSAGVASFGGGGIHGSNEYELQINTNDWGTTSACARRNNCRVWQQFLYATGKLIVPGGTTAAVYIEYWLINWGANCPTKWNTSGSDCWKDSAYMEAPDVPITELGTVALGATATAGGEDTVTFFTPTEGYSQSGKDSVLDISSVWTKIEFNVVGDEGGSIANFNKGSSIEVDLGLVDGSDSAPTCLANEGTTGETNNLNLGTCSTWSFLPWHGIEFKESN